jgi:hypothetical protein
MFAASNYLEFENAALLRDPVMALKRAADGLRPAKEMKLAKAINNREGNPNAAIRLMHS